MNVLDESPLKIKLRDIEETIDLIKMIKPRNWVTGLPLFEKAASWLRDEIKEQEG